MEQNNSRIGWLSKLAAVDRASFRLRCLMPALALKDKGYSSFFFQTPEDAAGKIAALDVLVINKEATSTRLDVARRARQAGKKVIYDLCDPVFLPDFRGGKSEDPLLVQEMLNLAHAVSVNGPAMAQLVREKAGEKPILEVADQVVSKDDLRAICASLPPGVIVRPHKAELARPKAALLDKLRDDATGLIRDLWPRRQALRRIIWFGRAGNEYKGDDGPMVGLRALIPLIPILRKIDQDIPLELIIVSDSYRHYRAIFSGAGIRTRYYEWSLFKFYDVLAAADLALLPGGRDRIAQMSSGNRIALALSLNVPVVRGPLENERYLTECSWVEDWENGIRTYLTDQALRTAHLARAASILDDHYSADAVARQWHALLSRLLPTTQ